MFVGLLWVCAQPVLIAQTSLLIANFHVAWYQIQFKSFLLHSHLCQTNSLSIFKFGPGVSVRFILVWKTSISLKRKVRVTEKKGLSLLKSWLKEDKFCIASGGSQNNDCFAAPGKGLVSS